MIPICGDNLSFIDIFKDDAMFYHENSLVDKQIDKYFN